MTYMTKTLRTLAVASMMTLVTTLSAGAAGPAPEIERQDWTFSGFFGEFDKAQLQRGFKVYKEVCSSCHTLKRVAFRNLAEKGGPEFPEESVKALAATYQVDDGPNDEGKMFKRPGRLSDRFPSPYANDKEARLTHNGALPPDLSLMPRARTIESNASWYAHPFIMLKEIANGYQESGADYLYALLTGYADPPSNVKMAEGMNYNKAYPGNQIAMINPMTDGQVEYTDGTPATVENYARDVTAFLSWTADPHLEARKRLGWRVMLYLLIMTVLLYFAKRRVWARVKH